MKEIADIFRSEVLFALSVLTLAGLPIINGLIHDYFLKDDYYNTITDEDLIDNQTYTDKNGK